MWQASEDQKSSFSYLVARAGKKGFEQRILVQCASFSAQCPIFPMLVWNTSFVRNHITYARAEKWRTWKDCAGVYPLEVRCWEQETKEIFLSPPFPDFQKFESPWQVLVPVRRNRRCERLIMHNLWAGKSHKINFLWNISKFKQMQKMCNPRVADFCFAASCGQNEKSVQDKRVV